MISLDKSTMESGQGSSGNATETPPENHAVDMPSISAALRPDSSFHSSPLVPFSPSPFGLPQSESSANRSASQPRQRLSLGSSGRLDQSVTPPLLHLSAAMSSPSTPGSELTEQRKKAGATNSEATAGDDSLSISLQQTGGERGKPMEEVEQQVQDKSPNEHSFRYQF